MYIYGNTVIQKYMRSYTLPGADCTGELHGEEIPYCCTIIMDYFANHPAIYCTEHSTAVANGYLQSYGIPQYGIVIG